jgi:hypothetical protein
LFFKIIGLGKVSNGILYPKWMLDKHCIKRIIHPKLMTFIINNGTVR